MGGIRTADKVTRWQKYFFLLLRCGLWERDPDDLTGFPLTDEEWSRIYGESVRQTVEGLLYQGILLLPEEFQPPHEITWKWIARVNHIENWNRRVTDATRASLQLLRKADMEPVLMKGQAIGSLYGHPEWRASGDIDWFLPMPDGWSRIISCLKENGISPTLEADGSLVFIFQDVEIELHRHLIDVEAPGHRNKARHIMEEEGFQFMSLSSDLKVQVPSPLLSLIMLNAHIMKHAFSVGVGLRQFCDMARASHIWHGQYDVGMLIQSLKQLGLMKWSDLLYTFLSTHLGLPVNELPYPLKVREADCNSLLQAVMRGANFGQQTSAWQSAAGKDAITWHTVQQFIRHLPMSMRYAPWEMICKITTLTKYRTIHK